LPLVRARVSEYLRITISHHNGQRLQFDTRPLEQPVYQFATLPEVCAACFKLAVLARVADVFRELCQLHDLCPTRFDDLAHSGKICLACRKGYHYDPIVWEFDL
jgi:hypothetical protein